MKIGIGTDTPDIKRCLAVFKVRIRNAIANAGKTLWFVRTK